MPLARIVSADGRARLGEREARTIMSRRQGLLLAHDHHGSLMLIESAPRFLSRDEVGQLGRRVR
ncbi:MAG TPA: hypothetical protein VHN20_01645 [Beijerinckiaceae bacterium]|nr:hypothetical protein [Beijerinckiaceae bacterium]